MPNILQGSWRQHVVLDVGTAMTRLSLDYDGIDTACRFADKRMRKKNRDIIDKTVLGNMQDVFTEALGRMSFLFTA